MMTGFIKQGDPLYGLFTSAEREGYAGRYCAANGILDDGRPFLIVMAIGDGVESICRDLPNLRRQ
jgi:hypothetical protein